MHQVLVIDDHPPSAALTQFVLRRRGLQVLVTDRPKHALQLVHARPFSVIVLGIRLPELDGLAFTRLVKADPATRSIKVLILTADAMKVDQELASKAGADGYLTKPVTARDLGDVVMMLATSTQTAGCEC